MYSLAIFDRIGIITTALSKAQKSRRRPTTKKKDFKPLFRRTILKNNLYKKRGLHFRGTELTPANVISFVKSPQVYLVEAAVTDMREWDCVLWLVRSFGYLVIWLFGFLVIWLFGYFGMCTGN